MSLDPASTKSLNSSDRETILATDKEIAEVEADLNALMEENPSLLGGEDVAELLQRLASAESMAEDMESKVDSVLQKLDELLSGLHASENIVKTSPDTVVDATLLEVKDDIDDLPLVDSSAEKTT